MDDKTLRIPQLFTIEEGNLFLNIWMSYFKTKISYNTKYRHRQRRFSFGQIVSWKRRLSLISLRKSHQQHSISLSRAPPSFPPRDYYLNNGLSRSQRASFSLFFIFFCFSPSVFYFILFSLLRCLYHRCIMYTSCAPKLRI